MTPCWFDISRFEALRAARRCAWGMPLEALDCAASTNDLALAAERAGAPEGATFIVRDQTRGRGRRGNDWWAAPGDNLTCSVLLRPELDAQHASSLPLVVGLAVRQAVSRALGKAFPSPPVLVKWPNDVWVGSRKIAGILVESRLTGSSVSAAIVGIGINVHTLDFPAELVGRATSLARELAPKRSRAMAPPRSAPIPRHEELLIELLHDLAQRYARFRSGGLDSFLPELEAVDALKGRVIVVEGIRGTALGITPTGALRLLDGAGRERLVQAGHVEIC